MSSLINSPWKKWSTDDCSHESQYEVWSNAIEESCSKWDLEKRETKNFNGKIEMVSINNVNMLNFISNPCSGKRSKYEISKDSDAFYTFDIIRQGQQILTIDGKRSILDKNYAILWDSQRKMDFDFTEKIQKIMIRIPIEYLDTRFPRIDEFVGQKIDLHSGIGKVTSNHILSLYSNYQDDEDMLGWNSMVDLSVDLIINCLYAKLPRTMTKSCSELLANIKDYINKNIDDFDMTPHDIAEKFYISNRYLHMLFKDEGVTVANYIKIRRLELCRKEIMRSQLTKESITDIAFRYGFSDLSNFSRSFKNHYGILPSALKGFKF